MRLIQGALRADGLAFKDEKGPVLPLFCHHGSALWLHLEHKTESLRHRIAIHSAGYNGVRFWDAFGGNWWAPMSLIPWERPSYYDGLADMLNAYGEAGLKVEFCFGGLDLFGEGWTARLQRHLENCARAVPRGVIVYIEANEGWQTVNPPDPSFIRDVAETFAGYLGGGVLWNGTSPPDPILYQLLRWCGPTVASIHDDRGGTAGDNIRRTWSMRWQDDDISKQRQVPLLWWNERLGNGTSVNSTDDPATLAMGAAMSICAQGGATAIPQRDCIKWEKPFVDQPLLRHIPKVLAQLPEDIMTWPGRAHCGHSTTRVRVLSGCERFDHFWAADGRLVGLAYEVSGPIHLEPVEGKLTGVWVDAATGKTLSGPPYRMAIFIGQMK